MTEKTPEKPRYSSNSEKQAAYRARKKREKFMGNDLCVTQMFKAAKERKVTNFEDYIDLMEYCYDVGGERLTQLIALKMYGLLSLVNGVYGPLERRNETKILY